jgi:hypothetical protein
LNFPVWLEFPSGERVGVAGMCSIGREPSNRVAIASERVSRRHAVIREEPDGSFLLVDLGSSNGTYLNGQRLARAMPLLDGAVIEIGLQKMVFRAPLASGAVSAGGSEVSVDCWLLVLESTELGCRTASQQSADKTFESWTERAQRTIQKFRGTTMRALNQGLLAYWRVDGIDRGAATVALALNSLRALQMHTEEFYFALHAGKVTLRSEATRAAALQGNEVMFAMQLQKLSRSFNLDVLISEPAKELLGSALPVRSLTVAERRGYKGAQQFFTLAEERQPKLEEGNSRG